MKNKLVKTALVLFIAAIALTLIILTRNVLIPFVVSVFFMYLLYPLVWQIEKRGVNRVFSILIVIVLAIVFLAGATLFTAIRFSNTSVDLVQLKEMVETKIDSVQHLLGARFGLNENSTEKYFNRITDNLFSSWEKSMGNFFSATTTIIFQIGILPVFTFFLLYYRTKLAYFILRFSSRENRLKSLCIMREISNIATRYMGGVLMVVLILALLNSLGLYIVGVPHAIVLGILAALLNLIPYIGTFIGGLIPVLYVFFTFSNPFETVIKVIILFVIVQFTENNILTPNIVGNNVRLNPLAIILSLLLANLVWGVAGMLIVVPCLAMAKIVMRNIDELKPFAYLISDRGMDKYRLDLKILRKFKNKDKHESENGISADN